MMYSARKPRAVVLTDEYGESSATAGEFIETDDRPTGLLDADGNPLYRQRDPIGFDLRRK